jgi:hypothetical protein
VTEIETRLQRALAADISLTRDVLFRVQVIMQLQRAAFRRHLAEALADAARLAQK